MIEVNRIYNEDNLVTMGNMPDEFVDLTVASPPYDDIRDYKGYFFDFHKMAAELFRVTKDGGVVVWIVGDQVVEGSESGTSFRHALWFMQEGFRLHDTMIYMKDSIAFPETNRYSQVFEFMFVFSKGKPKTFNCLRDRKNKWAGHTVRGHERQKNGDIKYKKDKGVLNDYSSRYNVWLYGTGGAGKQTKDVEALKHPAIFPEQLAADHIHSWSNKGDLVYDPFMGSGTTAKMAHLQGRNWIGSEISKEYCDIAEKRIAPYLQQTNMFH
jgi:site-specific DNA-methyltransferase (adenine-specific)